MNILGCVLRIKADALPRVKACLQAMPGVHLATDTDNGKLALAIEDTPQSEAAQTFAAIALRPDVLSALLVYEHTEPDALETQAIAPLNFQSWRTSNAQLAVAQPMPPNASKPIGNPHVRHTP